MNINRQLTFYDGVKACIPTVLGYMSIGLATGVIGNASNLSVLEVTLMSIIVYAGASQFIITGMMLIGSPISAIVLTAFLINSRHFLMSMATAPHFKRYSLLNNIGIGSLLTDESFAVSMSSISKKEPINDSWMHGLNVTAYLSWIVACFLGALIGQWLPDPEPFGLDFALVAMFIGLLYLQLIGDKSKKIVKLLIVMASVALILIILMRFMSPEAALLAATLIGCLIGVVIEK
ncbi:AzlC family ABC transporter permease [Zophobihabitans entericus]|uniref:AzlC family ABC transporter permease n=1 Tax=Zophobihabitans entericus TaxID=1635327 RepID=A0A6G9IAI9_9GAMM|nr:AzlC family ABC transporter permease [Zophobihabitans entericus]QIQ21248.1 AzlC family ABC transporter permease [Zophobihabitans entericus]